MNTEKLQELIAVYYDCYSIIYNEHREHYKWDAFKHFADNWDIDAVNFAGMLKESLKMTENLINNSKKCPTTGIIKLAQNKETTETVRQLFKRLYSNDDGDLKLRQSRIEDFRDKVNDLLYKYERGNWKYEHDFRTVLFYLTLRYPKDNYLFKSKQAEDFQSLVESVDYFGCGSTFDLSRYYRMCDKILQVVIKDKDLLEQQHTRLGQELVDLDEYHILVFDIIYCIVKHQLYVKCGFPQAIRKRTLREMMNDAQKQDIQTQITIIKDKLEIALKMKAELLDMNVASIPVTHKTFGQGVVTSLDKSFLTVKFGEEEKIFSFPKAFVDEHLLTDDSELVSKCVRISELEKDIDLMRINQVELHRILSRYK